MYKRQLQEAVRWFEHFLKGVENDVMAEPKLRAFIQDSTPPRTHHEHRDGRWIGERDWPSPEVRCHDLHLTDAGLREAPGPLSATPVPYNLVVGQFGGDWGAIAMPHEQAPDQRHDDALSLCFDGLPLSAPIEILGNAVLTLRVAADRPLAMLAVRLNEIRPDGAVVKLATGFLNLAHRGGSAAPEPLEPGVWVDATVQLSAIGCHIPAGHRLRVSLSPSYWPVVWPSPEVVTLQVAGPAVMTVPLRQARDEPSVTFQPRETAGRVELVNLRKGREFARSTEFLSLIHI